MIGLLLTVGVGASTANAAVPRILIVTGQPLPHRIVISDWDDIFAVVRQVADSAARRRFRRDAGPRLTLSMFWGSAWDEYVRDGKPVATLRPGQADQVGYLYPAWRGRPAVLDLPWAGSWPRPIPAAALGILRRHGIPVALESTTGTAPLGSAKRRCPVTIPAATVPPDAGFGAEGFNYGSSRLRAALYWPKGALAAGTLPDGGSMATIEGDGSIRAKVGWWRKRGKLAITGRRVDGPAPPLRASVNGGYGDSGFQPTALIFPTVGCWRVTGKAGGARLAFVVKVTKLEQSIVHFDTFRVAVPSRWYWRSPTSFPGHVIQLSNAGFLPPGGGDPIKEARPGTFVLTLVPRGIDGPATTPTITRRDFLAQDDLQRPRGRSIANQSFCTRAGPCVAISLVYRGDRVPASTLAAINRTLASLRATRTP